MPRWTLVTYRLPSPVRRVRHVAGPSGAVPQLSKDISRVPTYTPKASEIERAWYVVDAEGLVLGRVATEVARILRGKHKPIFAPTSTPATTSIIVNADKVVLTAGKAEQEDGLPPLRLPGRHQASRPTPTCSARKPAEAVRRAVRGMLPEEPPRPPAAQEAQGLRRPDPPARRPAAAAARARRTLAAR